jgi:hypothetical protein
VKPNYVVGLLLIGLVIGLALGVYVLDPAIPVGSGAGKNNQVQVNGEVSTSLFVAKIIEFTGRVSNATIDTTVPVDTNGHFSVVVVGGTSYEIDVYGASSGESCYSSLYIPSGVSTVAPTIVCQPSD